MIDTSFAFSLWAVDFICQELLCLYYVNSFLEVQSYAQDRLSCRAALKQSQECVYTHSFILRILGV